ncbi:MAG: GNAT family N-acetyltransferase [Acetobacter sp.]|nr:GNAT family N-acetyltransferase [Acetobacter sp.]
MKYRILTLEDCFNFMDDLLSCYECNSFVLDNQSPLHLDTAPQCRDFIAGYVQSSDSYVLGVFDNEEKFLYGIIIFDNIRMVGGDSIAQVHIVTDRKIWGKKILDTYNEVIEFSPIKTLYCEIPQIAVHAIGVCKRLGFKKTGYIPKALPYTNSRGEEKLYDINIFVKETN